MSSSSCCEFYLTKGSIERLAICESLFDKSSQRDRPNETSAANIRLENPTPILKLADFQHFTYCQQKGQRYGLVLTDGESEITATIDQTLFYLVEDLDKNVNQFLRKGSVILLKQYKIVSLRDLLNDKEYEMEQNKETRVLCLTDLLLLGHCVDNEIIEDVRVSDQVENDQQTSSNIESTSGDTNQQVANFISQLDPSLNKTDWSIACKILAKTIVRQYENTKTGKLGKVQRFLLEDSSGLIELVAFNHFCEKEPVVNIELNKCYLIKNGDIRKSNSNLKAWCDRKSVDYEIQMSLNCQIFRYDGLLMHQNKQNKTNMQTTDMNLTNMNKNTHIFSSKIISNEKNHQIVNANGQKLHEKFTKLNELIYAKPNSFVDVIGIVCEIGALGKMNETSKLSLRNIKLIDEANIPISVAFWGKQAEDFSFLIGTCLLINKIKVTTFGGVSLSVMRTTSLIEIKHTYQIASANRIFAWWTNRNNPNEIEHTSVMNDKRTLNNTNESDTDTVEAGNDNKKQRIN